MNKKKIAIVSIASIFLLIALVLLIRDPSNSKPKQEMPNEPAPVETIIPIETPVPVAEQDESHKLVVKVIDDASNALAERAPGWWEQITDWVEWFLMLDTKYAIILILLAFFLIGIVFNPKNRDQNKR